MGIIVIIASLLIIIGIGVGTYHLARRVLDWGKAMSIFGAFASAIIMPLFLTAFFSPLFVGPALNELADQIDAELSTRESNY